MAYFIGIDFGTSSVKAAILRDGSVRTYRGMYPAGMENMPEGWWQGCCSAVRCLTEAEGAEGCAGIGLTAQVGTYILCNGNAPEETWPVYNWSGPGGSEQRERLQAEYGTSFFMEQTGMPLPMVNSFPVSRIRWCIEAHADEWARTTRILAPKDILYEKMTGQCIADSFSWNGLVHPKTGEPTDAVLRTIGLDRGLLPRFAHSLQAPAGLTAAAAEKMGLPAGTPVYLGCNDAHASFVGMGVCRLGQAFDLTGTSEHVGVISREAAGDGELVCSPFFQGYTSFGVTASSGPSLDWAMKCFEATDDDLLRVYRETRAGRLCPPVFLPYVHGERTPLWDGSARGAFLGLSDAHTPAMLRYSVFEGVVFSTYHIWRYLPEAFTAPVKKIRLGGGACESPVLNRMKADLFGTPLEIPAEKNTGALGAGLIAMAGAGAAPTLEDAVNAYVRTAFTVEPEDPANEIRRRFEYYLRASGLNRELDLTGLWNG